MNSKYSLSPVWSAAKSIIDLGLLVRQFAYLLELHLCIMWFLRCFWSLICYPIIFFGCFIAVVFWYIFFNSTLFSKWYLLYEGIDILTRGLENYATFIKLCGVIIDHGYQLRYYMAFGWVLENWETVMFGGGEERNERSLHFIVLFPLSFDNLKILVNHKIYQLEVL